MACRYEVRVPKEETDMVGDLRYSWRKLKKLALDVSDSLSLLQVGSCFFAYCLVCFMLLHRKVALLAAAGAPLKAMLDIKPLRAGCNAAGWLQEDPPPGGQGLCRRRNCVQAGLGV
jgi:hypothetical protein